MVPPSGPGATKRPGTRNKPSCSEGWLWFRWCDGPPLEARKAETNFTAFGDILVTLYVNRIRPYLKRYTPLALNVPSPTNGKPPYKGSLAWVLFNPAWFYCWATLGYRGWGTNVALWHSGFFALLVVFLSNSLICKDLHWRVLLAPGVWRRGQLATHIVVHTWWLSTLGVAILVVPIVLGLWWAADMPIALALAHAVLQLGAAPIELFFATSVATLVRALGLNYWQLLALACAGVGVVVGGCWLVGISFNAPLYTVGPGYLAVLAVAGFGALWAANKLWTVERLMQCTPKQ